MPFYNCACSRDLGVDTRARIAEAIGTVHCGLTGAPPHFVNVLFLNDYPLRRGEVLSVIGNVRTGGNRTPALIDRLRRDLHASIAFAGSLESTEVVVKLIPIDARWVMEGGQVVPEPGDEEELELVAADQSQAIPVHASAGVPKATGECSFANSNVVISRDHI